MSAIVCGKRSNSIFDDLLLDSPPVSKRIRCSPGASSPTAAARFSPPRTSSSSHFSPFADDSGAVARLRSLFPDMDQQILEKALEACGNDLDSAIKSLNDLRLESVEINLGFTSNKLDTSSGETNGLPATEGIMNNSVGGAASENQSATNNLPQAGSEWVDLFVREMMSATDMDDARARASQVLEVLEKSIVARAGTEATGDSHKENMMLKEQVEILLRENTILKRAVAIQHESQQQYGERCQELHHLKQLVSQYQEQLSTLEVNNYALTMHLRQTQQNSSIPGRFHPDIF